MLTGSSFIHITAEFVRRFADMEGMMRICTEPAVFESAFREVLKAH
jgi:phage regulator Rha-like protein